MNTDQPDALYFEITSHREVRDLASQILSRGRSYPVIALTARPGEHKPALSVKRIREIVGPDTPIYFLTSYSHSLRLSYLLPRCLSSVSGGAGRLWWPGVDKDSRPEDHPKFYGLRGDYQDMIYEWLEGEFRPSPTPPLRFAGPLPLVHVTRYRKRTRNGRRVGTRIVSGTKILAHFASSQTMGHGELAARLSLSRSCAHRCLVELTWLGYLVETREHRFRLADGTQRHQLQRQ